MILIDFESLLLGPIYDILAPTAVLTDKRGVERTVSLLDHRDGRDITTARGGTINILQPGINATEATIYIRHSECPVQPIGWKIAFEGEDLSYEIRSAKLKGRPGKGEWELTLQKD